MTNFKDITGQVFHYLKALEPVGRTETGRVLWRCKCKCDKEIVVCGVYLRNGDVKSCGCIRREQNVKHRLSNCKLYRVWNGIKSRCYVKKQTSYKYYGKRGVRMCPSWEKSFVKFYEWSMSNGYKEGLTIDRIDVNGNYCPENCRWITNANQQRNRRNNRYYILDGETLCVQEIFRKLNFPHSTYYLRWKKGIRNEKELFEGVDFNKHRIERKAE